MDLCFELATEIMARIGEAVEPVDEVHGFRYFDNRDLIGFVDGTENPEGEAAVDAADRRGRPRILRRQRRHGAKISSRSGRRSRPKNRKESSAGRSCLMLNPLTAARWKQKNGDPRRFLTGSIPRYV